MTSEQQATISHETNPDDSEYVNPLEQSPRWVLAARALAIRSGASLSFGISNTWAPPELAPAKAIWLDALLGEWKAKQAIRVEVWEPPQLGDASAISSSNGSGGAGSEAPGLSSLSSDTTTTTTTTSSAPSADHVADRQAEDNASVAPGENGTASKDGSQAGPPVAKARPNMHAMASSLSTRSIGSLASIRSRLSRNNTAVAASPDGQAVKRPVVINFHGGGFILGEGTDDARWCSAVATSLNAVVFSVNYRLAPGYPFPTAVEDCVSAIVQLCAPDMAARYGIDTSRVVLSGFSAGGNLALASWAVLQDPARWGYDVALPSPLPPLAVTTLALFYPLLDWTLARDVKRRRCPRPDLTLPKTLTDLFDASYLHPPLPRASRNDPRLSPGLMPDVMVARLPPVHLCLCEHDMLLAEGLVFAERLRRHGRQVEARVVKGEKHAWDKPPLWAPKESAAIEYDAAIASIRLWMGAEGHKESSCSQGEQQQDSV